MLRCSHNSYAFAALILTTITHASTVAVAAPEKPHKIPDSPAVVEMKSLAFEPKLVNIVAGQKVIWRNTSYTQHSATGDVEQRPTGKNLNSPDESSFDTGLVDPKGESKPIVFTSKGSFAYHCSVHGKTMSGVVVVKELAQ